MPTPSHALPQRRAVPPTPPLKGIEFRYAEFLQWAQQRLDFRARALRPYGVGDAVELFVRRQQTWRPGVVEAGVCRSGGGIGAGWGICGPSDACHSEGGVQSGSEISLRSSG